MHSKTLSMLGALLLSLPLMTNAGAVNSSGTLLALP